MWKVVLVWLVVVLSGQLPAATAVSDPAESRRSMEGPQFSPSPDAVMPLASGAPHAAGEEDRPEEECDEDDDSHSASTRHACSVVPPGPTGNTQRSKSFVDAGHATPWPLPPDAN